jgi:Zn finger protein HypA/HybF involved in hydrogenase expression
VDGQVLRIEGGRYVLGDGSGGLQCVDCDYRLDMEKDKRNACPNCGSTHLRWQRWE